MEKYIILCILEGEMSYVVGHVMVLYSPDLTNIGFSFILLAVNLFRHLTQSSRDNTMYHFSCIVTKQEPRNPLSYICLF